MPKGKKSSYQWFIEPRGDVAYANQVINNYLHYADERVAESIRDTGGNPHNVWQCSYNDAKNLRNSEDTIQAHFVLWNRETPYGPIRYVNFLTRRKKRKKETEADKPKEKFHAEHPRAIKEETLNLSFPF